MSEISESDWKALSKMRDMLVERYSRQSLAVLSALAKESGKTPPQRFYEVCRMAREMQLESERLFTGLSKERAGLQIMMMDAAGILKDEDIRQFGPVLRGWLEKARSVRWRNLPRRRRVPRSLV